MTVETIRPGRTIELVEATLVAGERPVIRARAWRIARVDTRSVAGGMPEPLPPPDTFDRGTAGRCGVAATSRHWT